MYVTGYVYKDLASFLLKLSRRKVHNMKVAIIDGFTMPQGCEECPFILTPRNMYFTNICSRTGQKMPIETYAWKRHETCPIREIEIDDALVGGQNK